MTKKVFVFDLDDTLIKEIDFLKSGYWAVSEFISKRVGLNIREVYGNLLDWYRTGQNAFAHLNEKYGLGTPIEVYLDIYRFHTPDIHLSQDMVDTLNALQDAEIELGIVTDGRFITQKNKVDALGLAEWFDKKCVIINSNPQFFKPNSYGYNRLMQVMYEKIGSSAIEFTYIADNPEKDFIWPNANGWNTICLKDDGRNIHKQDFAAASGGALPKRVITSLKELIVKN